MSTEALMPGNSTIILIDYAIGFANLLRSHDLPTHVNNAVGLAKLAVAYETGLVITNGVSSKPSGPLYPELRAVLGARPVIERPSAGNAFLDPKFAEAVRATGRKKIILGGVSTEGCVLQTALAGQREGYEVYVVVDACASLSAETHEISVIRMVQAGIVPLTWFALSGEFSMDQSGAQGAIHQKLMAEHVPAMNFGVQTFKFAFGMGRAVQ
ncbi:MAG TPA: isochorismatase family protein [Gemmatimonadaceae bacterium]|nr:isochorismatase family protein [Gemmatimonadaceae bacterium]